MSSDVKMTVITGQDLSGGEFSAFVHQQIIWVKTRPVLEEILVLSIIPCRAD
jgi:hypothetical protein